ncbi:hypothetical protein OROGR_010775 [Orobanche gracilis]
MWKHFFSKLPRKPQKPDQESPRNLNFPPNTSSSPAPGPAGAASPAARRASAVVFPASVIAGIEPLLAFKDVPSSERMNLFISKLSLCCVVFDFTDAFKNLQEKELKRATLLELLDFVSDDPPKFSEPVILASCKMCTINLSRVFPPSSRSRTRNSGENDNNEDEPTFDPAWAHLQIVYDPRERDCLKAIVHRIYGKFMVHRPFIRKSISNVFYGFVFETGTHNGIAELLEIFGSVITGFALPLKEEHKLFFWRLLMPLHKPKSLGIYFQQLSYCVTQFIEKEPILASGLITGMLKYWPITSSQKEVMYLGELEEILEVINMSEFQKVMVPLFGRIKHCIKSYHFQVAERALFLWNNDRIVNLISHNRHVILPIVFPALEINARSHWNQAVLNLTSSVRKMLAEMDDSLITACICDFREEQEKLNLAAKKRKEKWEHLDNAASLQPIAENTAVLVTH